MEDNDVYYAHIDAYIEQEGFGYVDSFQDLDPYIREELTEYGLAHIEGIEEQLDMKVIGLDINLLKYNPGLDYANIDLGSWGFGS